ncbi:MAG: NAD(P)-binding domain-containing protein [Planctomycetota bacterium]
MLRWLLGRPDYDEVLLPVLKDNYQSTVPGLYIVGDLAGAPTIRSAANQGVEVMAHIGSLPDGRAGKQSDVFDVVIIGGGSSGIAAAMEAKCCQNLSTVVIESGRLANTIREFPKGKEIYAEPKSVAYRARLWLEDSVKEELLEKWDAQLSEEDLDVREDEKVTDIKRVQGKFEVHTEKGHVYQGRRVVLAIGKRGNPRKLGVTGEELDKVHYKLYDPDEHAGQDLLVVGGGDSAVEAAAALAEVGTVTLSYRREGFFRLKSRNRERIDRAIEDVKVTAHFESNVKEITPDEVVLEKKGEEIRLPNDNVFVAAGAELPQAFFKKVGIRMEKQWTPWRFVALALVGFGFWLMYAGKKYPPLWPWSAWGVGWNDLQLTPNLHWWEWFTILYSAATLIWGIKAMRKYWYSKFQRWKYASVIFFQCFALCILPLFILPHFVPDWYTNAGYAFHIVLAWPLSISAISQPLLNGHWGPFAYALTLTFVIIPVFVHFHGSRFCSWICGCGCLAETLGDEYRNLAPRGPKSIRFERFAGRFVLGLACVVTFATFFFSSWARANEGISLVFYGIWIDTMLAGALGLGLYWFFGNRVWCRFFCPLRMYMNIIGSWMSRFRIVPSEDKCIACGQCSRECQMGIPVMDFAKRAESVTLSNSSCIGCGICVDVCPVDVLHWNEEAAAAAAPKK